MNSNSGNCSKAGEKEEKFPTLISVTAKILPKHILGPYPNVSRCLYPCISDDLAPAASSDSFNHRFGLNWAASAPHSASELLTPTMGIRMIVPLGTKMASVRSPEAVRIGWVRGRVSFSCACREQRWKTIRTKVVRKECD